MPDDQVPSTDAIRFTYDLDGAGGLELVDATFVSMTTFDGDDLDLDLSPFGGFWFELRDGDGNALWRHVALHPQRGTVELFGAGGLDVVDDQRGVPVVSVAIPAVTGAASVALVGAPPDQLDGQAVELLAHVYDVFVR